MRSIYEINADIMTTVDGIMECVDEETGEVKDDERLLELNQALNSLQMERDNKIEAVALYIKQVDAEAKALKDEEENLKQRRKRKERAVAGMKEWISATLDGQKFETTKTAISFRKSTSVMVYNEAHIPTEYIKVKEERSVDKTAVKKAIQNGVTIDGAELVTNYNVNIK